MENNCSNRNREDNFARNTGMSGKAQPTWYIWIKAEVQTNHSNDEAHTCHNPVHDIGAMMGVAQINFVEKHPTNEVGDPRHQGVNLWQSLWRIQYCRCNGSDKEKRNLPPEIERGNPGNNHHGDAHGYKHDLDLTTYW